MTRRWLLGTVVIASLVVVLSCVCEPCDEGMRNKELVAEVFAVMEAGEFDKLDDYIAADYVRHCQATPEVNVTNLQGMKDYLSGLEETFPDQKMVIHRLVAEDDLVAFWASWGGVQEGPMGPFPATGKRMELDFAGMHRIADGKIAETWVTWDNLTGLTQVGLFPPPPPEEATPE
jgi:predicted ester cyclase